MKLIQIYRNGIDIYNVCWGEKSKLQYNINNVTICLKKQPRHM